MAENKTDVPNKIVWVRERTHALLYAQAKIEGLPMQEVADRILCEQLEMKLRYALDPTTA